tara:strand:- start:308 stop:493 length:186 start_codon:yes stop_codon:yes gene_type:complete
VASKLTPCRNVCTLEDDICIGCGRTTEEISDWTKYNREKRLMIMRRIKNAKRLAVPGDGND